MGVFPASRYRRHLWRYHGRRFRPPQRRKRATLAIFSSQSFRRSQIARVQPRRYWSDCAPKTRRCLFDETLYGFGDWDLLFRLTRAKAPLVLPVLACYYTTSAPNRLSKQSFFSEEMQRVREKLRR